LSWSGTHLLSFCALPRPTPVGRDGDAATFAAVTSIALATAAFMNFVISGRRLELNVAI
jgi:hypothetical protein